MLFKTRFHAGIRDGSIVLTFRAWKSARVTPGKRYRLGARGAIEVETVERVSVGSIRPVEARHAGFTDVDGLVTALRATAPRLTRRSKVFRVAFRYAGEPPDPREALRADVSAGALDEVAARLERMDRASRHGPWTGKVLHLIGKHPGTAAARLAEQVGRDRTRLKADVRKLKALGLTESLEVGYRLSPRGRAFLSRTKRPR